MRIIYLMTMYNLLRLATDMIPARFMSRTDGRRTTLRRIWWHAYEIAKPKGLFRIPVGHHRMLVDTSDTIISFSLIKHGVFERGETALVRKLLRPGDVFVDGGANIGYYTLMSAELVGPQGKVFAFEPEPRNYSQLRANIAANWNLNDGRIVAHQIALGDQKGAATIYLERDNLGAHSLHPGNLGDINSEATVLLDRLDDALPANQHIDVIKLDTQGAEPDILAGAAGLIHRCHPILLLEWWPWGLRDRPNGAANFVRQLEAFGYIAGIVSDTGFVEPCTWPSLLDRCAVDQHHGLTVICSTRPLEDLLPASMISAAV